MQELNETQINTEQLSVKPAVRTSLNPILKIISHHLKKKKPRGMDNLTDEAGTKALKLTVTLLKLLNISTNPDTLAYWSHR